MYAGFGLYSKGGVFRNTVSNEASSPKWAGGGVDGCLLTFTSTGRTGDTTRTKQKGVTYIVKVL